MIPNSKLAGMLADLKDYVDDFKEHFDSSMDDLRKETRGRVEAEGAQTLVNAAPIHPQFIWSQKSLKEMEGVKPELKQIAIEALKISTIDFIFFDGVRTKEDQRLNVERATSKTMNSRHLIQPDGFGWAMDLVPLINGVPKWDWDGCFKIALALDTAATRLGYADHIIWGGCWDRRLSEYGGDKLVAYAAATQAYSARHPGPDFIDGPHFEWHQ